MRRQSICTVIALASVLAAGCLFAGWRRPPTPCGSEYAGLKTSEWEMEIVNWDPWGVPYGAFELASWCSKRFGKIPWRRRGGPPACEAEPKGHRPAMPLLRGDPAAIPVLTELLDSRSPRVRRLAAQGLEHVGPRGKSAAPALLRLLDDSAGFGNALQARMALLAVDPETASRLGIDIEFQLGPLVIVDPID